MFTIVEPPKEFEPLNERCRQIVQLILEKIQTKPETFKLRSSTPLYADQAEKEFIYVVKEGNLSYSFKERTLFYFQEGDIIGFECELDIFHPTISSDFAVVLDKYPMREFLKQIHSDPGLSQLWQEFLGRYIAALYVVARSLFKDAETVIPEVRNYSPGDVILAEGAHVKEIFTMADGYAYIQRGGENLDTISMDEIFGLYSALTETPSQGSVVAKTDCLILAMTKEQYLELIMSRPQVVKTILNDMARTVVKSQNQLAGTSLKL